MFKDSRIETLQMLLNSFVHLMKECYVSISTVTSTVVGPWTTARNKRWPLSFRNSSSILVFSSSESKSSLSHNFTVHIFFHLLTLWKRNAQWHTNGNYLHLFIKLHFLFLLGKQLVLDCISYLLSPNPPQQLDCEWAILWAILCHSPFFNPFSSWMERNPWS